MSGAKSSRGHRPRTVERLRRAESAAPTYGREDAAEVAEYIAQMSAELAKMAGNARFATLTYFLNLARLEAEAHAPKFSSPPN